MNRFKKRESPLWSALACGATLAFIIGGYCSNPSDVINSEDRLRYECNYVKEKVINLATENKDYAMLAVFKKVDWCKDEEKMESDKSILAKYLNKE
jgi:hypothetical protein